MNEHVETKHQVGRLRLIGRPDIDAEEFPLRSQLSVASRDDFRNINPGVFGNVDPIQYLDISATNIECAPYSFFIYQVLDNLVF